jgi:DNA-binding FadR family transcriptional regulator
MEKLEPGEAAWEKADLNFHSAIAATSHNVIAIHIMDGVKANFNEYFKAKKLLWGLNGRMCSSISTPAFLQPSNEEPPKAKDRMKEHLEYVAEVIRRDFEKAGAPADVRPSGLLPLRRREHNRESKRRVRWSLDTHFRRLGDLS